MQTPLVSVIITTYNRFEFLCRAIDSVLCQTYENIEIIVVDDCSSDGTEERIKKYFKYINYVRNQENHGLSASRNVGIRIASGDYISFLDDDDELFPEKIEKQISIFLENRELDVVYCGWIKRYLNISIKKTPKLKNVIFPEVLDSCPGAIHTLLIKKKCFFLVGFFDEKLEIYEDFDFWIRLSQKFLFDYIPEPLVVYNFHGCQMTIKSEKDIPGRDVLLDKHKDLFWENKSYLYRHLRRQASNCAVIGEYKSFYRYIFKSIQVRPAFPGSYVHLIISVLSRKLHKSLISGLREKCRLDRYFVS